MPPPTPLPPALHRVLSILPGLASPRHLLQAHAFLLPRGGHRHPHLLSALLLASLRLPLRARALALLHRLYPYVSLKVASRIPHLRGTLGPQLHSLILRAGLASDAHVSASLIQAYCSCALVATARNVFDEMTCRDIFAWNIMIEGVRGVWRFGPRAGAVRCYAGEERGVVDDGGRGVRADEASGGGGRGVPEDAGGGDRAGRGGVALGAVGVRGIWAQLIWGSGCTQLRGEVGVVPGRRGDTGVPLVVHRHL